MYVYLANVYKHMGPYRAYQPIWEKLKADGKVSITANRLLHPRIIKAVIKEKWMDIGYKMQIEPATAFLSHEVKFSVITFTLTLENKTVPDLRKYNNISISKLRALLKSL